MDQEFKTRLWKRLVSKDLFLPLTFVLIVLLGIWEESLVVKILSTLMVVVVGVFLFVVSWYMDLEDGK